LRAASRIVAPADTSMELPSMVRMTMVIADPPIIEFGRGKAEERKTHTP
jgi:hypothetical protein